jgi:hypothetical protein
MVQFTRMGSDTAVQPTIQGMPHSRIAMRLLRRVLLTQDRKRPQDLIPNGDASGGPAPESGATDVFAGQGLVLWAWLDLNQRPHPYQVSRAQRCADRHFPRSRATVRAKGCVLQPRLDWRTDVVPWARARQTPKPWLARRWGCRGGGSSPIERRDRVRPRARPELCSWLAGGQHGQPAGEHQGSDQYP